MTVLLFSKAIQTKTLGLIFKNGSSPIVWDLFFFFYDRLWQLKTSSVIKYIGGIHDGNKTLQVEAECFLVNASVSRLFRSLFH